MVLLDSSIPIGSMYAIYGNMDPINIPPMLAYIPAPWILWDWKISKKPEKIVTTWDSWCASAKPRRHDPSEAGLRLQAQGWSMDAGG